MNEKGGLGRGCGSFIKTVFTNVLTENPVSMLQLCLRKFERLGLPTLPAFFDVGPANHAHLIIVYYKCINFQVDDLMEIVNTSLLLK